MKKTSYSQKIFLILQGVLMIPLTLIIIFIFNNQINLKIENETMPYKVNLDNAEAQYKNFRSLIDYDMRFLNNYDVIRDVLNTKDDIPKTDAIDISNRIEHVITSMSSDFDVIIYNDNPYVYLPKYFRNINELKNADFYTELCNNAPGELSIKFQNNDSGYISIFKKYASLGKTKAFIEIRFPYRSFIRTLFGDDYDDSGLNVSIDGKVLLLERGAIVDKMETDFIKDIKESRGYTILKRECDGINIYMQFNSARIKKIKYLYIVYMMLTICVVWILGYFMCKLFSKMLTKGLDRLVQFVDTNDKEDFDLLLRENNGKYDEFDMVYMQIEKYINKINEETAERQRQNERILKLEFQVLQEQISPHFLYNTLASIKYAYEDEELDSIIDSIVSYYRLALGKGNNFIKIKDEMNAAIQYLKIQKFAYDIDFDVRVSCEKELEDGMILRSLLQPIVENAFFHGINVRGNEHGFIKINCLKDGDYIKILVENNGPVISDAIISAILSGDVPSSNNGGFGLKNVMERIKLYYGNDCGLEIKNSENTCVIIRIRKSAAVDLGKGMFECIS